MSAAGRRFAFRLPKQQVRRNTIWNIVGQGFPLFLAVFFIPPLIRGIGTDKFGALTLVWTFLTYFSLFDMGIGRSLTQLLAVNDESDRRGESQLVWTTFILLAGLGIVAAALLFFLAPFLVSHVLRLRGALAGEMTWSLRGLGLALPVLLNGLALKGILEAKRRFDLSNLVRMPLGIFTYGAPLLILPFTHNLAVIVAVLLLGRVLAWAWNLWMVFRILPHLKTLPTWNPGKLREVLHFGGWVTLSSVVIPVLDSLDRLFITTFLSISLLAYYATPFELISKLWIISAAVGGTVFPEFAARFRRDPREAGALYMRAVKYIMAFLFPIVLLTTAYAREGLNLWLNPQFAATAAPVLQWLSLAVLVGGIAQVPYFFLLGVGRPRIPATLHVIELPVYAAVLFVLIKFYGVQGAAVAFLFRVSGDFLGQLFFSGRALKFRAGSYQKILIPLALGAALLIGLRFPLPAALKAALVAAVLAGHAVLIWRVILEAADKATVRRLLGFRATPHAS